MVTSFATTALCKMRWSLYEILTRKILARHPHNQKLILLPIARRRRRKRVTRSDERTDAGRGSSREGEPRRDGRYSDRATGAARADGCRATGVRTEERRRCPRPSPTNAPCPRAGDRPRSRAHLAEKRRSAMTTPPNAIFRLQSGAAAMRHAAFRRSARLGRSPAQGPRKHPVMIECATRKYALEHDGAGEVRDEPDALARSGGVGPVRPRRDRLHCTGQG